MSTPFTVQSQIVGVRALNDGGLSLNIHTKELETAEKAIAMDYQNKSGWLLFSENQISEKDIPAQDSSYEGKTPSQRLRAVLYILYTQKPQSITFEEYYRRNMETFIQVVKTKLDSTHY